MRLTWPLGLALLVPVIAFGLYSLYSTEPKEAPSDDPTALAPGGQESEAVEATQPSQAPGSTSTTSRP